MKKLKHEAELFKAALLAGVRYAEGRNAVEFEATDSASDKALYVYRLLVHDKIIAPMPEDQVSEKTIRHRLATWYAHQLPDGHRCWDRGDEEAASRSLAGRSGRRRTARPGQERKTSSGRPAPQPPFGCLLPCRVTVASPEVRAASRMIDVSRA